ALERALVALRAQAPRQLWCVFGCGGDRDPGKRRAMGEIARARADRVIVTDDNPRQEDPRAIVEAILAGTGPGPAVEVIHDRAAAIRRAILGADAADLVLIAGKGHETGQIIGGETRPFSDRAVAAAVLGELA
ncbi:MAG: UDP-N-acetylmuramoyl-L-alanyl-D-glutamate--2,6-diaminopimelate ligase, partial [Gammaproteobacteria bacterium]|nr:UDP-N-acetylmuramoyl-L-alanyl-D-glutamate--2,6-diaminopimelate ligase [Gammaproteobacteria bacterium]